MLSDVFRGYRYGIFTLEMDYPPCTVYSPSRILVVELDAREIYSATSLIKKRK